MISIFLNDDVFIKTVLSVLKKADRNKSTLTNLRAVSYLSVIKVVSTGKKINTRNVLIHDDSRK